MISAIALPFVAIIELDATPFQVASLRIAQVAPAFVFGLVAGALVDRMPRRPLMIGSDAIRALLLLVVPLAAVLDVLSIWLLLVVAAGISVLTILFDVAYQAYLPSLTGREQLLEANSKVTATASIAESSAFAAGGWLVQVLTAPFALLVNAVTFVISALAIRRIDHRESEVDPEVTRENLLREAAAGMRKVVADARLLALVASSALLDAGGAIFGAVFLLYVTRELDFEPGMLGLIFAVGGVSSLIGAVITGRVVDSLGTRRAMVTMLLVVAVGHAMIPISPEVSLLAIALLVAQQLIVDPAWTVFDIANVSTRQQITEDAWLGRVNGTFRMVTVGAVLIGSLVGAWVGSVFGLQMALWVSVVVVAAATLPMLLLRSQFSSAQPA